MSKRISEQTDSLPGGARGTNRMRMRIEFPELNEPILGENQGDSGKTPSTTHSTNLPMTNNMRPGKKSRVIFDK